MLASKRLDDIYFPHGTPIVGDNGVIYVRAASNSYVSPSNATHVTTKRLYALRLSNGAIDIIWYHEFSSSAGDSWDTHLVYEKGVIYHRSYVSSSNHTLHAVRDDGHCGTPLWSVTFNDSVQSVGFYPNDEDPLSGVVAALRGGSSHSDGPISGQIYILCRLSGAVLFYVNLDVPFGLTNRRDYVWITSPVMTALPMNESFATPTFVFGVELITGSSSTTTIVDTVAVLGARQDGQPILTSLASSVNGYRIFTQIVPFAPDDAGRPTQLVITSQSTFYSVKIG